MKQAFTLFIFSVFASSGIQLHAQTTKEGWRIQRDSVYNFTFLYPDSWTLKLPGTTTRFFVTSKAESDTDQFRENVNCIARQLQQKDFKVSDAADDIKKTLAENLKEYTLIHSGYSTWNNAETLTLEYTCSQESNGNKYNLHLLQKIAVVKGILFTFTYTADAAKYDKFLTTINKIINSVKIR